MTTATESSELVCRPSVSRANSTPLALPRCLVRRRPRRRSRWSVAEEWTCERSTVKVVPMFAPSATCPATNSIPFCNLDSFSFGLTCLFFRRHHEGALNLQDQKMTNQNFSIAGKCRTWKMMDRITGLENDGPRERCTPMYSALNTTGSSTAGIYLSPAKCNN